VVHMRPNTLFWPTYAQVDPVCGAYVVQRYAHFCLGAKCKGGADSLSARPHTIALYGLSASHNRLPVQKELRSLYIVDANKFSCRYAPAIVT
jgi:hypothetical protein